MKPEFTWERGFRCHGYWNGIIRLGHVSLPPPVRGTTVKTAGYGWGVSVPGTPTEEGRCKTLDEGRRTVERRVRELLPRRDDGALEAWK